MLYLQLGWAENEYAWWNQGRAILIMDNLITEGKTKPFIIVMTYGLTNERPGPGARRGGSNLCTGAAALFEKVKLVFASCGSRENAAGIKANHEALNSIGLKSTAYVSPDTVLEFQTGRRSLYHFAPLLFRDRKRNATGRTNNIMITKPTLLAPRAILCGSIYATEPVND